LRSAIRRPRSRASSGWLNPLRPRVFGGKGAEGVKKEIPSNKKLRGLSEEPGAGKPHAGICELVGNGQSYVNGLIMMNSGATFFTK